MALQMDIMHKGIMYNDAYIRIEKIVGSKPNFSVYLSAYTDSTKDIKICDVKNDCNNMSTKLFGVIINSSDTADNYHKQAYEQIKQLDKFKNATDV